MCSEAGASALVWIRMYANAWAYIRRCAGKGALWRCGAVSSEELNVGEGGGSVGEQPEAM